MSTLYAKSSKPIAILALLAISGTSIAALAPKQNTKQSNKRPPSQSATQDAKHTQATKKDQRSLNQRTAQPVGEVDPNEAPLPGPAIFPFDYRTINGIFNNPTNPLWGAAGTNLTRMMPADYADGHDAPSGADRPSVRHISNAMCAQDDLSMPNEYAYSDFIWQWGQFLDHDLDETPIASPQETMDIPVPMGDAWFDPNWSGTQTIALDRSAYTYVNNVREQINNITSYIDASNVYGSSYERATELRTNDGTGRLKTSPGNLLPFNINAFHNAPTDHDPSFFLAGDIRANEQAALTAMHTLFVREHNRIADEISAELPILPGELVYQYAKAMVTAEIQAITYNEFLPKLLGPDAIPPFTQYDPSVNASISNVFATAAYRVGHTMLSSQIQRLDSNGNEAAEGHLPLAQAFFNPAHITTHGIESLLRGLAHQRAQTVDVFVVDDVRNFLFGQPGAGGFDLASLNMQRGRDHAIPSYNQIRVAYGLPAVTDFSEINPSVEVVGRLQNAYADVDQIDAWIGLLAEPHRPGAYVGETLCRVLGAQFTNLRDGDRFWYETYLPADLVAEAQAMTLAQIIRANTTITTEIQDDVFTVEQVCAADFAEPLGTLNFLDVSAFINLYSNADPAADFDNSGTFNFLDITAFLAAFGDGCP